MKEKRTAWIEANGPCVRCGSKENLQVDHKDPTKKVDHKVWSWSKVRREAELAKCQVLCIECHKKKSAIEAARPTPHGTDAGYTRNKCRCADCRAAHSAKRQQDKILYGC
jgi:5-methylcytosine-specific restriction endonuclease McrA